MDVFELSEVVEEQRAGGRPYLEFFRVPDLSLGIYTIPAGGTDPQLPHDEDEVYVVASGNGSIHVEGQDQLLVPGSIVFVAKHADHRFHSVTEDLSLLVLFAPAQGSNRHDTDPTPTSES